MSNEAKILELLQAMQTDMTAMKTEIQKLKAIETKADRLQEEVAKTNQEVAKTNQEVAKINLTLENGIQPQITLLAEGQGVLLQKMAPQSELDELREKVKFLETIVRLNTQEIERLKKAQ